MTRFPPIYPFSPVYLHIILRPTSTSKASCYGETLSPTLLFNLLSLDVFRLEPGSYYTSYMYIVHFVFKIYM